VGGGARLAWGRGENGGEKRLVKKRTNTGTYGEADRGGCESRIRAAKRINGDRKIFPGKKTNAAESGECNTKKMGEAGKGNRNRRKYPILQERWRNKIGGGKARKGEDWMWARQGGRKVGKKEDAKGGGSRSLLKRGGGPRKGCPDGLGMKKNPQFKSPEKEYRVSVNFGSEWDHGEEKEKRSAKGKKGEHPQKTNGGVGSSTKSNRKKLVPEREKHVRKKKISVGGG